MKYFPSHHEEPESVPVEISQGCSVQDKSGPKIPVFHWNPYSCWMKCLTDLQKSDGGGAPV